jgi:alanine dehydrogenase/PNT-like protein
LQASAPAEDGVRGTRPKGRVAERVVLGGEQPAEHLGRVACQGQQIDDEEERIQRSGTPLVYHFESRPCLIQYLIRTGAAERASYPTTHDDPIYVEDGAVHYCVANMPSIVPHTSTYALTNATLSYALEIADRGFAPALRASAPLRHACNVLAGEITHPGVASAVGATAADVSTLL